MQPWFLGLDWDKVYKRQIVPSWRPPVRDPYFDLSQIDKSFTTQQVNEVATDFTLGHFTSVLPSPDQAQFVGYIRIENLCLTL